ncbi:hypothetical protein GCM10009630_24250 [Kribbella jejuensis]|uniref:Uncharacterized protein n=1 Tax=Kribbella jejuensis TaxID=236068 RepID=A0A542D9F0_9ACTN|nr:hypothetical protein [Kribbella jejuensis]TQI99700.1 hypothetical protein FB475_6687 [Kribbella jejuensis]
MQLLAMLITLSGTILVTTLWKQLLKLVLVGAVLVFCFGLYNIVVVMTR